MPGAAAAEEVPSAVVPGEDSMEPMLAPAAGVVARASDLEAGAVVASVEAAAAVVVGAEARGAVVAVAGDVAAGGADNRRSCSNREIMSEGTSLGAEHRRSGARI